MSTSVLHSIDKKQSFCLNTAASGAWSSFADAGCVTARGSSGGVSSDSGAQLLLYLPFNETLRLEAISLEVRAPGPVEVKLWVNCTTIDFDDAETLPPTQKLSALTPSSDRIEVKLKAAKFATATSLSVLLDAGEDGVLTLVGLGLTGVVAGSKADVSKIEKVGHEH